MTANVEIVTARKRRSARSVDPRCGFPRSDDRPQEDEKTSSDKDQPKDKKRDRLTVLSTL
jgi:hypothetical protein